MRNRILLAGTGLLLWLIPLAGCNESDVPSFREGDIVFQKSVSSQSEALRLATRSPYTHTGVIFMDGEDPVVLEAVGPVKWTPIEEWIRHGINGHFVVKRMADADRYLTKEGIAELRRAGEAYIGRPYDFLFGWSDEQIYCSELVWKMYETAFGIQVGTLHRFGDFDLSNPAVLKIIEERFSDGAPLDETVIAPVDIFESGMLTTVYENRQ